MSKRVKRYRVRFDYRAMCVVVVKARDEQDAEARAMEKANEMVNAKLYLHDVGVEEA